MTYLRVEEGASLVEDVLACIQERNQTAVSLGGAARVGGSLLGL